MKILATDLAWLETGWCLWDGDLPDPILAYGEVKPKQRHKGAKRTQFIGTQIYLEFEQLIADHRPDVIVYEQTDWFQILGNKREWRQAYSRERKNQMCLGRAEMALLLVVPDNVEVVALGATETKQEYVGNKTASKATVAHLLANAYPHRLDFVRGDGRDWTVVDRKSDREISSHITDSMSLADVYWHRQRLEVLQH